MIFFMFPVPMCQYDNRTYGINQSIITANCKKICGCKFLNSNPITTCNRLCQDGEDPKCDPYSQIIEEYQAPVNGTNCICTKKKCVSGIIPFLSKFEPLQRWLCIPYQFPSLQSVVFTLYILSSSVTSHTFSLRSIVKCNAVQKDVNYILTFVI